MSARDDIEHEHRRDECVLQMHRTYGSLRVGEMANRTWDMVLDPSGQISGILDLRARPAKKGSGRVIPIHPVLRYELGALRALAAQSTTGYVIRSERGGPMTALSIVV